ncbi:hypothetical protein H6G80_34215 [Nostoc sp. FACHB-87]|uniref:hypothetical protein n=1 Tax=Nostocales TaxID=1161 RepID=UPI0016829777|nr:MULTISPECIES: hypothetical protein [Nostocales]MBD2299049.1 hypothetical protein [Nostoc sp. FACHB-190]MBD2459092.1 hypothetical protein [Nostoc sp. FACHB-87]MBD2480119.1 hypothetical protein [Anabaena sp. FACHB-83]MBD2488436.1 hypothetical protein [Aulosira sp. FACHB-615]
MEIIFNRPSEVYLENKRGLETIDTNQLFLLVNKSVEPTADIIKKLYQKKIWQKDVYNQSINISKNMIFIFQLLGHPWSIIFLDFSGVLIKEEDAQIISQSLQTNAIYYRGSDTSSTAKYLLYSKGIMIEKYIFENGVIAEFQSLERNLDVNNISRGTIVDRLVTERDAYIPSIYWDYSPNEEINFCGRNVLKFTNLFPEDIIRMDCLS